MPNLRPNDLTGVILSYLSIDEFKPKTGQPEDIVVVAFYAHNENAAADLKHFIETGMFNILDVEASDIPDDKNRFLIFVEIDRNNEFVRTLVEMLRDMENITGEMRWVFSSYMNNQVRPATPKNIKSYVITSAEKYRSTVEQQEKRIRRRRKIAEINENIEQFVQKSYITRSKFYIEDGKKLVAFHFADPDYSGTFEYKFHDLKSKANLKAQIEDVKGREGTLPSSVLKPLAIIFGKQYRVHNHDNLIFVVPQFNLDLILILGVAK